MSPVAAPARTRPARHTERTAALPAPRRDYGRNRAGQQRLTGVNADRLSRMNTLQRRTVQGIARAGSRAGQPTCTRPGRQ
jgi:hypothetical protein